MVRSPFSDLQLLFWFQILAGPDGSPHSWSSDLQSMMSDLQKDYNGSLITSQSMQGIFLRFASIFGELRSEHSPVLLVFILTFGFNYFARDVSLQAWAA
eukprot:4324938-Amphidinium_carterae.1